MSKHGFVAGQRCLRLRHRDRVCAGSGRSEFVPRVTLQTARHCRGEASEGEDGMCTTVIVGLDCTVKPGVEIELDRSLLNQMQKGVTPLYIATGLRFDAHHTRT